MSNSGIQREYHVNLNKSEKNFGLSSFFVLKHDIIIFEKWKRLFHDLRIHKGWRENVGAKNDINCGR